MQLAVQATDTAFHLGDLDPTAKGKSSYEAHGLSVSLCPEAWEGIAEITSSKIQAFTRVGAAYLDVLNLGEEARAAIRAWGFENGWLEVVEQFRMWEWDGENEEWRYSIFEAEDDALAEAAFSWDAEEGHDGLKAAFDELDEQQNESLPAGVERLVERISMDVLTPAGVTRAMAYGRDMDGFDVAAMFWVEDVARDVEPSLVGVWWLDEFAPDKLSAPRGAILPCALSEFGHETLNWDAYFKRADYFPETKVLDVSFDAAPAFTH